MSVGVDIIPTLPCFTVSALEDKLRTDNQFIDACSSVAAFNQVVQLPSMMPAPKDGPLQASIVYGLETKRSNSLVLSMASNGSLLHSEHLILAEVGKNLDHTFMFDLGNAWHRAGYEVSIETNAARWPEEPAMLVALAACIAELCGGYIVINEEGFFSRSIGVYTASEFRSTIPKFSGIGPFKLDVG